MAIWWRFRRGFVGLWPLIFGAQVALVLSAFPATQAASKNDQVYWRDGSTGYAIGGFDPVAYFVDAGPRPGVRDYEYDWSGVTWRFVSAANRAVFVRDPTVYAPQYGGYGAESVARGVLAQGSPSDWLIFQDRLYFFANSALRASWRGDIAARRQTAGRNWPKINRVLVHN